jgi:flagellar hook-associated protein 3 FlgL
MLQRSVLSDLNRVSDRLSRLQQKASSGKEITRPSDDPFNASRAMALRASLEDTRQYQRNLEDAQGWQQATEQALSTMTDAVHRARELLVHGASDTADATSRAADAEELDQLVQSLKQDANTSYGGVHLFAGTNVDTAPYAMGADDAYRGNGQPVTRAIGPNVPLDINVTGDEVLGAGAPNGGLLEVLRRAAADLRAGNGPALRGDDLTALDANLDHLLEVRARNGARAGRVESAQGRLSQLEEASVSQLSATEDADMAKTLMDFSTQQAAYQAALKAGANIVQASLMDFLR